MLKEKVITPCELNTLVDINAYLGYPNSRGRYGLVEPKI